MNYIKQLSLFYEKLSGDDRLTPFHISLYMALFQMWNINRFENPVSIARNEILCLSRIGSPHTYYSCLNELHEWDYIEYIPSKNPLKGSLVNMCIFDTSDAQAVHISCSKNDISRAQAVHPSINNRNITNNKTYSGANSQTENSDFETMKTNNQSIGMVNKSKRKKTEGFRPKVPLKNGITQKKEKVMQPPELEKVITFFRLEGFSEIEARKFFNHFESNGWRVGGKSPMKNWHAAARNWMLNVHKFNPNYKGTSRNLNNTKNYGEPL